MGKLLSDTAKEFIQRIYKNNKTISRDIRCGEENGQVMVGGISNGAGDFFYWNQSMLDPPRSCKRLPHPPEWWYDAAPGGRVVPMVDPEFSLDELPLAQDLVVPRV